MMRIPPAQRDPKEDSADASGRPGVFRFRRSPVRYPNSYLWFILLSAMDIMLTYRILARGGTEVNPLAREIIERWNLWGSIAFKFTLAVFVILICEYVGSLRARTGRWLALIAVGISAVPVAYSLSMLAYHFWILGEEPAIAG
jgi:hypothetical protein